MSKEYDAVEAVEKQPPVVSLDVPESQLERLQAYSVGDTIEVTLIGKVVFIEQRQGYNNPKETVGYLRMELRRLDMKSADDQVTQFDDLADD